MNTAELKITHRPDCKPTAYCISCGHKNECKELVVPRCCGVPKRPWDLCGHISIRDGKVIED